jgi:uncharacterized protein YggE
MRLAAIVFLILATVADQPALAQQAPAPPVIVVNGNANVDANPDEATVRLGVVRQSTTAQTAQEQTNRAASDILAAVTKLGVPAQRIRTSQLTLTPIYAPRRPESAEAPRIVTYNASNIVSIELDSLDRVGPVIDAGLKAGANQLEGVQFRLKNDLAAREQALRQAVSEAKRKAEVIAETLGVRLAGVLEVNEGGVAIMPKGEFGGAPFALARAADAATPVSPGQLEVHANVTIRYRIEPK